MQSPYGMELSGNCDTCPLRGEGFFCNLNKAALKAFDAVKFTSGYPGGAVLFVEGEGPRGIYVLCRGKVKLTMTSSDGKTMILRMVKPGEVLGLHAVVSGKPYQATAETMEPCQVNFVRRDDFLRFLAQNSEASIHAAQQLSGDYQTACDQIRSLGLSHSATEKLAKFLLETSAKGQETKQGIRVRMTMTHEEIGQMIGASRETVTRTLGEFRDRHLLVRNGSMLVIQDRAGLQSFAGA